MAEWMGKERKGRGVDDWMVVNINKGVDSSGNEWMEALIESTDIKTKG